MSRAHKPRQVFVEVNETGSEVVQGAQKQLLALADEMPRYVIREHELGARMTE